MDNAIYDKLIKKRWYQQDFLVSGTFQAPVTGVYFLTGCGAGGGGTFNTTGNIYGGSAGAGCVMYPVFLIAGQTITVTIGAGGTGSANATSNGGGDTSFGSILTLPGAGSTTGGLATLSATTEIDRDSRPVGNLLSGATGGYTTSGSTKSGNSSFLAGISSTNIGGGAGGLFGKGGDSTTTGTGGSAVANSGAGGGATKTVTTGIGGNGGSGRLIVQWQG